MTGKADRHRAGGPAAATITARGNAAKLTDSTPAAQVARINSVVVYTRDTVEPLHSGDPEMWEGWRCIPQPPSNDGGWVIVDDSHDYKTGWLRADWIHPNGGRA